MVSIIVSRRIIGTGPESNSAVVQRPTTKGEPRWKKCLLLCYLSCKYTHYKLKKSRMRGNNNSEANYRRVLRKQTFALAGAFKVIIIVSGGFEMLRRCLAPLLRRGRPRVHAAALLSRSKLHAGDDLESLSVASGSFPIWLIKINESCLSPDSTGASSRTSPVLWFVFKAGVHDALEMHSVGWGLENVLCQWHGSSLDNSCAIVLSWSQRMSTESFNLLDLISRYHHC